MKKVLLTLLLCLSSGLLFGSNFVLKKNQPSNSSCTAFASGEDYCLAGYSDGHIYKVNRYAIKNIDGINPGTKSGDKNISSIVFTQGNVEIGGDFAYIAGGTVYVYNFTEGIDTQISDSRLQSPSSLTYGSNAGLFCISNGKVYKFVNGRNWAEIVKDASISEKITAICYNNYKDTLVAGTEKGKAFEFKNKVWVSIGQVNNQSYPVIQIVCTGRSYYALSRNAGVYDKQGDTGSWTRFFSDPTTKYIDYNRYSNKILVSLKNRNNEFREIEITGGGFDSAILPGTVQFVGYDMTSYYAVCPDGYGIYQSQAVIKSNISVSVKFVSKAVKKISTGEHASDAVYMVTIQGKGLDQTQMFKDGYNGFAYQLKLNNNSYVYDTQVFPMAGFKYMGDGKNAVLNPRPISFYWIGPVCQRDGEHKLEILQEVSKSGSGLEILESVKVDLPAAKPVEITSSYSIQININNQLDNKLYRTGTCAFPFTVTIKDGSNIVDPSDDIYNHLVLYNSSGYIDYDNIAGANPFASNLAVLPSDSVEINGKVKYGTINPYKFSSSTRGRHFYAYTLRTGSLTIYAGLVDNEGNISCLNSQNINVNNNNTVNVVDVTTGSEDLSLNQELTLKIIDANSKNNVKFSNTSSDSTWFFSGYLDYLFGKNNLIYVVFPEGLNTRSIQDRIDLAKMQPGFYALPVNSSGKTLGLWSDYFKLNSYTSYCPATAGKQVYLVVFDQYGRVGGFNKKSDGEKCSGWDYFQILLVNDSPIPLLMIATHGFDYDVGVFKPLERCGVFIPSQGSVDRNLMRFHPNGYTSKYHNDAEHSHYIYANDVSYGNDKHTNYRDRGVASVFLTQLYLHCHYPHATDFTFHCWKNLLGSYAWEDDYLSYNKIKLGSVYFYEWETGYSWRSSIVDQDRTKEENCSGKGYKWHSWIFGEGFEGYLYTSNTQDFCDLEFDDHK